MSKATLLHREATTRSLKAIVECAHARGRRATLGEHSLAVRGGQLVLTPAASTPPPTPPALLKQASPDEGFESDVDSISLISAEEAFAPSSKNHQETDSANGSACSDSDDGDAAKEEVFNLVSCVCYTDTKYPDTLVFVIDEEALVYRFDDIFELKKFHSDFSTIKAVANQRAYNTTNGNKFNLLQRTDSNGVTHIEISRAQQFLRNLDDDEPTSIISINTPESYPLIKKSMSSENLLDDLPHRDKRWSSVENLLDQAPKKPERRKKNKAPAPPPPQKQDQNILKGQFIRVNVPFLKPKPQQQQFQQFKFSDPKMLETHPQITHKPPKPPLWSNSIPRLLKKSKSDQKLFIPMAYRYIDTTMQPAAQKYVPRYKPNPQAISNRLFGMSSKLKEFTSYNVKDTRYGSLGNLNDGTLKSVIKKDDVKKKNEKKVTFSAYNTVQVV